FLLGVVQSEEQFAKLAEAATRLGQAVGRSATDALNDLTVGIGRQSRMILDNLGILVNVEQAYVEYAAAVGKTVDELEDYERRQAFFEAASAAIEKRLRTLGPAVETAGGAWAALGATIANTLTQIAGEINGTDLPNLLRGVIDEMRPVLIAGTRFIVETVRDTAVTVSSILQSLFSGEIGVGDIAGNFRAVLLAA